MAEHLFMPEQRNLRGMLRVNYVVSAVLMGVLAVIGSIVVTLQAARVSVTEARFWLAMAAFLGVWFFALRAVAALGAARIGSADLYAEDQGLRVQVGKGRGVLLPWEKIGALRETRLQPMFGPEQPGEKLYLIDAPGQGLWYLLAGVYLGGGFRPVAVISTRHGDHEALLGRLGSREQGA